MKIFKSTIVSLIVLGAFFGILTFAQETEKKGTGLTISPLTFELSANPGDLLENTIKVSNPTQNSISVKMEVDDFTALGEEGEVRVEDQKNDTYSLKKWTKASPEEFTLTPGQTQLVDFKINLPQNAEPGGKYGSILATITGLSQPEESGAVLKQKIGALVLLSVAGEVIEKIEVKEFSTPKFSEKGPINFTLRFENKGTVHTKPRGIITITDIFGNKVQDIEIFQKNVLPGAIRKVEATWQRTCFFGGRYQATLVGNYGSQNEPLTAAVMFWVFPWRLALIVLLSLVLIILVIRKTYLRVKKAEKILKENNSLNK